MAGEGSHDQMPDLSHLDDHERRIIEQVMHRQRLEEEKELELVRRKRDEVRVLEDTIRLRSESQRRRGVELDATCQICLKTKFADGVGHLCHYCNVRCCARCGGKVTLRSNKLVCTQAFVKSRQKWLWCSQSRPCPDVVVEGSKTQCTPTRPYQKSTFYDIFTC